VDPDVVVIPGAIVLLLALGRFWDVGKAAWRAHRFRRDGVQVEGKVVGLTEHEPEEQLAKQLVVEFTDHAGAVRTMRSQIGLMTYQGWEGRTVTVTYLRDDPRTARIDSDSRRAWILSLVLGLVLAGVGGGLLAWAFTTAPVE